MAGLNDNAVFKPTTGHYWKATTGTAAPTNLLVPGTPWTQLGHTSIEDILSISSDGGEATVLGTLQNPTLRQSYSTRTETMAFTLQQFDLDALKLYFGANATVGADGLMSVPSNPTPTECAFLLVLEDGANKFAFYAPKASIFRGDDLSIADTENFAGLPLAVTPLVISGNDFAYKVTPLT